MVRILLLIVIALCGVARAQDSAIVETARRHIIIDMHSRARWRSLAMARHDLGARRLVLQCVDGRGRTGRWGVPGASLGVFLRMLNAYVVCIDPNRREDVIAAMREGMPYLVATFDRHLPLRFHTDDHIRVGHDDCGCGYLSLLKTDAAAYGFLCPGLVDTAVHELGHGAGRCEVLIGEHDEYGVLVVEADTGHGFDQLPMIVPWKPRVGKFFVYHPQVERLACEYLAPIMHRALGCCTGTTVSCQAFRAEIGVIAQHHAELSLRRLARGRPIYHAFVHSTKDGGLELVKIGRGIEQ